MTLITTTEGGFWPSRRWWAALAVLLLAAAALRFTGYNFSLPYVDHPDEPNHAIAGRLWIDQGSAKALGYQGYPPGILTINYILLRFFHDPATPPTALVGVVRLISITATLLTLILVALLAYRMSTPFGGLLAAGIYAVSTPMVEYSRYGTPDSFVTLFTVFAIFSAVTGTKSTQYGWTRLSIFSMMLAIVFKYQAIFLLPLILLLPLVSLSWLTSTQRTVLLRHFAANVGYLAAFGFWLILIYPTLEANEIPNWVAPSETLGSSIGYGLVQNAEVVVANLQLSVIYLPAAIGLVWLITQPKPQRPRLRLAITTVALALFSWHFGISLFGDQDFRQFIAEAVLLIVFTGAGLGGLATLLEPLIKRFGANQPSTRRIANGAIAAGLLLVLMPQVQNSIANAYRHTLHDRRNDLARYVDTSLPPGPYIAERDNDKTLNGAWGGYAGANIFHYIARGNVDDKPIDEWRERGAIYAIESYERFQEYATTEAGRAILDETLLLKSYPPSDDFRGPSMVVLRLTPIQHETDQPLGPVTLVGYDIDAQTVAPGETVTLTLYWQAEHALDSEYAVYNHLTPLDARTVVTQVDNVPLFDVRRPTQTWDDPDETFISRPFTLTIPDNTGPGTYRLLTGFYRRSDGARLTNAAGEDFVSVTTIEVE